MNEYDDKLNVLTRIVVLETRLASTIEKLDSLISEMSDRYRILQSIYEGDRETPSLLSRVISIERFNATLRWSISVIYVALIGILLKMIGDKL